MLLRNQRTLLLCFNLALLSRQDLIPGGCHTLKAKMIGNVFKGASHLILQTSLVTSLHSSLSTGLHICFCTFSHLTNHMILRFPISNSCAGTLYSLWHLLVHNGGLVFCLALFLNNRITSSWSSIGTLLHFHVAANLQNRFGSFIKKKSLSSFF